MPDTKAPGSIVIEILPEDVYLVATGYEIDADMSVEEFDGLFKLEHVAVLNEEEVLRDFYLDGEEAFRRTVALGNRAGLRAANALIRQKEKIPDEWKGTKLLFTGAVIRNRHNEFYIGFVQWDIFHWVLTLGFLDFGWRSNYRLAQVVPAT